MTSTGRNILQGLSKKQLLSILWRENPGIHGILKQNDSLRKARDSSFELLNRLERRYYNIHSEAGFVELPQLEKNNAVECIRVLENLLRTENEELSGFSALKALKELAGDPSDLDSISEGFLCEFIFLFRGAYGNSRIYSEKRAPAYLSSKGRSAALARSRFLDSYSKQMSGYFRRYTSGLDKKLIRKRAGSKKVILDFFNASEDDWTNYKWHLKNAIYGLDVLEGIVPLSEKEKSSLRLAEELDINFQISPYYLSLFSFDRSFDDSCIRAQVLPSADYSRSMAESLQSKKDLDFMQERSTSPVLNVTRRYPQIVIVKPFDACPQICVYCQRNWEIRSLKKVNAALDVKPALKWLKEHKTVKEVLVTGGDPLSLSDSYLDRLLGKLAAIPQLERIRIGTRTFVTVPFRISNGFAEMVSKYHQPGEREVCMVTHFEHSSEITPDSVSAVRKIKQREMSVYNQQVFTYFNSKKFETAFLRKKLKLCGIDPYYLFNTKGKKEALDFRVPIARILQERKEEARLLPGLVRTDEPVFNVPRLGKSHLRAWQDHEIIMVLPDGRRVYRFLPWESKISLTEPYVYTDVSVYDYLARLANDKEDLRDYSTIWYYF